MNRVRAQAEAGFSLLEVLVAITIVSLMAATVVLSIGVGRSPLRAETETLVLSLHHAHDQAIATGLPTGLALGADGESYAFLFYLDGRWWPVQGQPTLSHHDLAERVRIGVQDRPVWLDESEPEEAMLLPLFWFDPAGLNEPFELWLDHRGDRVFISRSSQGDIRVRGEGEA